MSVPSKPPAAIPDIQTASDMGNVIQATLQDGTVLWIPKTSNNTDYAHVEAWADQGNIIG